MERAELIQNLVRVGGSRWQKNGMDRVYFNYPATWYGLETQRYNSGNILSATLDGEGISNSEAKRILARIEYGKVWYDAVENRWYGRELQAADLDRIVGRIRKQAGIGEAC